MTRELFQKELAQLQDDVLVLGSMAEKAVTETMEALRAGDHAWSQRIIDEDARINEKRFAIEDRALFVIASQQPLASDLRAVVSALYIIVDLERIADHAEGIARINLLLGDGDPLPRDLGYIPGMADRAVSMLRDSLKAYIEQDVQLANRVCNADDEVDRLQDAVYEQAFQAMIDDPATIQRNTYYLWASHNMERIADRCTNIAERAIYLATGKMQEINVSKY